MAHARRAVRRGRLAFPRTLTSSRSRYQELVAALPSGVAFTFRDTPPDDVSAQVQSFPPSGWVVSRSCSLSAWVISKSQPGTAECKFEGI
ncbi:hypothetical protein OH77DRAFT_1416543 [Trametes cingulata]|nr:hypothetical protein OH77DRAFT_1416543 [Trametes cingulata]